MSINSIPTVTLFLNNISDKDVDPANPFLIPYNNVPMSVSQFKGKLFITIPRRAPGVPSVLYYVPDNLPAGSSPNLRPYPDYKTNELHVS